MMQIGDREVRGIIQQFQKLPDPRSRVNRRHLLVDVIVIAICAMVAGADGPVAIEEWAKMHRGWLKRYLGLKHGIPSHDTIGRVLEAIQPEMFQECFSAWLQSLAEPGSESGSEAESPPPLKHYAIDGKTLRRSHDWRAGLKPLHLVSVWATERGVTLGQVATEEKSNEITAIPELLARIELHGAVVTIDAAGCQRKIAEQIINGGGDYVLAVKGNQEKLHRYVQEYLDGLMLSDFKGVAVSALDEEETRHGRTEHRYYYQVTVPKDMPGRKQWVGLKTLGAAIRVCETDGERTIDTRFYISSQRRNIGRFARLVRGHWRIENTLHWSLDMTFREDETRTRQRHLADNLAWLRRLALTLLKQHPYKQSLVMKRRMAGWNADFLLQVLTGKTFSLR
jgi:predicted transposase YbfD/YdcC